MRNHSTLLNSAKRFYDSHAPDAVNDPFNPLHWKEKVLYLSVFLAITIGPAILIPSLYYNAKHGYNLMSIAATGAYLGCLLIFFFHDIRFKIRAVIGCGLIYLIGITYILSVGPFLATREWLFCFSIMASIFLGWTGTVVSISINVITWGLIGVLIYLNFWENLLQLDNTIAYWNMIAVDLLFINISTPLLISLFFDRIEKSDQSAKTYSQLLLAEGKKLSESNQKLELEIEDRKAITQALRKSEEKYRSILETIHDSYFEVDLNGNLTFFNKALCERLEYDPEELMGMSYRRYTNRQNAEKLFEVFNNIYVSQKRSRLFEIQVISKNNTVMHSSILVSLLIDNDGNAIGFQGIARDITEQKQMENQLRQAQKMEALGTLAGSVAHDLNNTLSGVVNYPELLLTQLPETDPLRKPITAIKKSGEKAVAIVQDLLTLARRNVSTKEIVNLNVIILEYLQSNEFQTLASFYPGIEIETRLEKKLFNINGSPVHLSKAVMNLISNAVESIAEKGVVCISTQNRTIKATTGDYENIKSGDYVVLTIQDNGSGIAPEDLDKIFEPYFTKKKMGRSGTGLGMAVVWGTVRDHNGHIDIQSTKENGSTFSLYFPVTIEEVIQKPFSPSFENFKGRGENILVVDDVETQREIATDMLKILGYAVTSVKSGEDAVDYLKTNSVDLIVLDMIMKPGIDGLETYRRILQLHPGQKAVIASGYSETDRVKEAQNLGAGKYIRKPYSLESIGTAIRETLGSR